jgi:antitoxin YefM
MSEQVAGNTADDSSMAETLYLLSTPANAQALARAVAQDKDGEGMKRQLLDVDGD